MNPVLKVRDVCLSYHTLSGETPALSHISFDLMPGEFLSIVGPSGCGKSTLLNLIAGLLTPEHGSITLGRPAGILRQCRCRIYAPEGSSSGMAEHLQKHPSRPGDPKRAHTRKAGTCRSPSSDLRSGPFP